MTLGVGLFKRDKAQAGLYTEKAFDNIPKIIASVGRDRSRVLDLIVHDHLQVDLERSGQDSFARVGTL